MINDMGSDKEKYSGAERRKYARLRASIVEYCPIERSTVREMTFTENLGGGGICFLASERLQEGTLLSLKIYLSNMSQPISAKGKVAWIQNSSFLDSRKSQNYDLGVEFIEIDEEDRKKILDYTIKYR